MESAIVNGAGDAFTFLMKYSTWFCLFMVVAVICIGLILYCLYMAAKKSVKEKRKTRKLAFSRDVKDIISESSLNECFYALCRLQGVIFNKNNEYHISTWSAKYKDAAIKEDEEIIDARIKLYMENLKKSEDVPKPLDKGAPESPRKKKFEFGGSPGSGVEMGACRDQIEAVLHNLKTKCLDCGLHPMVPTADEIKELAQEIRNYAVVDIKAKFQSRLTNFENTMLKEVLQEWANGK